MTSTIGSYSLVAGAIVYYGYISKSMLGRKLIYELQKGGKDEDRWKQILQPLVDQINKLMSGSRNWSAGISEVKINQYHSVVQQFMESSYHIAPATRDQIHLFQQIQSQLGWDALTNSYLTLYQICPQGLLLGKLNGVVISCCLALKYSDKYGFLGVYWVHHKYRGKGYGLPIFERAMQILKTCEVVALDSVNEQIKNYSKWGFEVACNSTKRYQYPTEPVDKHRTTILLKNAKDIDPEWLAKFDEKCFPAKRLGFLKKCMEIGRPFVSIDPKTKQIVGYAMVTTCESGLTIGPLIAISPVVAEDIIKQIFSCYPNQCLVVFCLDQRPAIQAIMEKYFPEVMYNCKRMFLKTSNFHQDFDRSCVYAFSNYERG